MRLRWKQLLALERALFSNTMQAKRAKPKPFASAGIVAALRRETAPWNLENALWMQETEKQRNREEMISDQTGNKINKPTLTLSKQQVLFFLEIYMMPFA